MVGHNNLGIRGFNADVWQYKGYAYLGAESRAGSSFVVERFEHVQPGGPPGGQGCRQKPGAHDERCGKRTHRRYEPDEKAASHGRPPSCRKSRAREPCMGTAMAYPAPLIFKPSGGVESRDSGTGFVWFCVLQGSRGRAAGPEKGVSMKLLRSAVLLAVAVTLTAGVAGAHPDEDGALGFHDHLELLATSPPAPSASSGRSRCSPTCTPGPARTPTCTRTRGMRISQAGSAGGVSSKGVRVYDLSDPRNPVHVSTFADAAGDPTLARTWTEKVIVKHVNTPAFSGDLAVVSFQTCNNTTDRLNPAVFRGFALYDVTDPANPTGARPLCHGAGAEPRLPRDLARVAGNRAYVYTAVINSEDRTGGAKADFRIVDVSNPSAPVDIGQWGAQADLGRAPSPQSSCTR